VNTKVHLVVFLAELLFLSTPLLRVAEAEPMVIRVPSNYPTIQEAIDSAAPESVILVSGGIYHENVVVNKTLTLLGEEKTGTIIDGEGGGAVILVRANNVLIDGFTVEGSSISSSIAVQGSENVTVRGNILTRSSSCGIILSHSNCCRIIGNIASLNGYCDVGLCLGAGIVLVSSHNNTLSGNIIVSNVFDGIILEDSNNNSIQSNTIEKSGFCGIEFLDSSNNTVHHNNFINNSSHIGKPANNSVWKNYWDSYAGLDDGSNGRMAGDGIGDTDLPYGTDDYPLVRPLQPILVVWANTAFPVALDGNSTISWFRFLQTEKRIAFNVSGPQDTTGYCNITIPKTLLNGNPWTIKLDKIDISLQTVITENQTHSSIYFTYGHNMHSIQITGTYVIPEFNMYNMLMIMLTLAFILVILKRKSRPSRSVGQCLPLVLSTMSSTCFTAVPK
jgi:parallel beta-helix repeat protein